MMLQGSQGKEQSEKGTCESQQQDQHLENKRELPCSRGTKVRGGTPGKQKKKTSWYKRNQCQKVGEIQMVNIVHFPLIV